ncbi:MAG: apolipoprotein N-acyltransferase [Gemmobacter sp.]
MFRFRRNTKGSGPGRARAGWRGLALAFLAGAGLALGQAPFALWPPALVALLAGVALIAHETRWRRAAWLGLFLGAGHFGVALHWIVEPFQVDPERHGWMAPFALFGLAFGLALFWGGAAALAVRLGRSRAGRALAFAAALAAAEALRGHVFTGFPWALVGHIWIGQAPMQVAALVGGYGLTLLTLLAAALAVAAPRAGAAGGAAILAAMAGFGLWQLGQPMPERPDAPLLRIVQPNAAQHLKWDHGMQAEFFARQLEFTAAPTRHYPDRGRPDLVVWPETAVSFLLDWPGAGLDHIAAAAGGVPVALGIQRVEGWQGFNSLAVIGEGSEVLAVYDKHHLVPFGEYIPFGNTMADLFGITAFAAQEGFGYTPGPGPELIDFGPLGRALPLICYEVVFPQDIRAAEERADWLLNLTNDAWFGDLAGPHQHLAQARLRAVEQGLPLVRAANTGVSAVIDARGRMLAALPLNEAGFMDERLPPALAAPLYARAGEWPFLGLLAAVALAAATRRRIAIDPGQGAS